MKVRAGRTLFISNSQRAPNHLWIVITDPTGDPPQVVIVSFTTRRAGADPTVIVRPGEHPFVVRETVIHYTDSRLVRVEQLQALVENGIPTFHEDCSEALLARIQGGVLASPFTPHFIKGYCAGRV